MRLCAFNGQLTPVPGSGANIYVLPSSTGRLSVQETVWSGYASSSTPMQTRLARCVSAGNTVPATLSLQRLDQTTTAVGVGIAYGNAVWTTAPIISAGAVVGAAWNAYGGLFRWLAAPGEEIDLALSTSYLACVPDAGAGVSAYTMTWYEL